VLRVFLSLLWIGLVIAGCDASETPGTPRFAIFLVDDTVEGPDGQAPPDAERLPPSPSGTGLTAALWLRREGGMAGPFVADARVIAAADGRPAVEFTLTQEGRDRFAALTRANVGRRLAVVVNGAIVAASVIGGEMTDGRAMLTGNYSEAQASALAAELAATAPR